MNTNIHVHTEKIHIWRWQLVWFLIWMETEVMLSKIIDAQDSEMHRLKRRFLRDEEQSKAYFVKRHTRLEKMREVRLPKRYVQNK